MIYTGLVFLFGMIIGLPVIGILIFYEDEIDLQMFYFVLFLRFLFMTFLWIIHFGIYSYSISWEYDGKDYEVTLPQLSL